MGKGQIVGYVFNDEAKTVRPMIVTDVHADQSVNGTIFLEQGDDEIVKEQFGIVAEVGGHILTTHRVTSVSMTKNPSDGVSLATESAMRSEGKLIGGTYVGL